VGVTGVCHARNVSGTNVFVIAGRHIYIYQYPVYIRSIRGNSPFICLRVGHLAVTP
jgi:hypothetical protein